MSSYPVQPLPLVARRPAEAPCFEDGTLFLSPFEPATDGSPNPFPRRRRSLTMDILAPDDGDQHAMLIEPNTLTTQELRANTTRSQELSRESTQHTSSSQLPTRGVGLRLAALRSNPLDGFPSVPSNPADGLASGLAGDPSPLGPPVRRATPTVPRPSNAFVGASSVERLRRRFVRRTPSSAPRPSSAFVFVLVRHRPSVATQPRQPVRPSVGRRRRPSVHRARCQCHRRPTVPRLPGLGLPIPQSSCRLTHSTHSRSRRPSIPTVRARTSGWSVRPLSTLHPWLLWSG